MTWCPWDAPVRSRVHRPQTPAGPATAHPEALVSFSTGGGMARAERVRRRRGGAGWAFRGEAPALSRATRPALHLLFAVATGRRTAPRAASALARRVTYVGHIHPKPNSQIPLTRTGANATPAGDTASRLFLRGARALLRPGADLSDGGVCEFAPGGCDFVRVKEIVRTKFEGQLSFIDC